MQITLRQFEYFLALAETGQVSKAAMQCNVAQSSVTVALRNMEQTLGVALFTRHAKGLRLTDAGERFVQHARSVTAATSRALEDMQASRSDVSGTLRVGVTETISAYLMPQLLSTIEQRFPKLHIQVQESDRASVERALMRDELDLALLLVSNLTQSNQLEYTTLLKSKRRLWVYPDHPIQRTSQVSLSDISQGDYILLDMDEHVHTMVQYWKQHKLSPNVVFQSRSLEAVRSLVAFQRGITILSDLVYRPWSLEGRRIVRRDVSEAIPTMDVGVVWSKSATPNRARDVLVQFLYSTTRELGQD